MLLIIITELKLEGDVKLHLSKGLCESVEKLLLLLFFLFFLLTAHNSVFSFVSLLFLDRIRDFQSAQPREYNSLCAILLRRLNSLRQSSAALN